MSGVCPPGSPEEDGDRFVEIWNLVFMQFFEGEDGTRSSLPRPSIDTGMVLERFAAVMQGKQNVWEMDPPLCLVEATAALTRTTRPVDAAQPARCRRPSALLRFSDFRRCAAGA